MILVSTDDDAVAFQAPFHPDLAPRCRSLGGRWKGTEIGWTFERSREVDVRDLCRQMFGFDGAREAAMDEVAVRVTVEESVMRRTVFLAHAKPIYLVGREVAAVVPGRKVARAGRGVKFLRDQPRIHSAGPSWCLNVPNGAVFEMRAVPRAVLPRLQAVLADAGSAELIRSCATVSTKPSSPPCATP